MEIILLNSNLKLYIHKKQIVLIFHVENELLPRRVNGMTTPALKFTHTVTTTCMVFHQISPFEFSLAFWTLEISMAHMCLDIVSMNMWQSFEFFPANGTSVVRKFDISN